MSLFNFFKKNPETNNESKNEKENSYFNDIQDLFLTPLEKRNTNWIIRFNKTIPKCNFTKKSSANFVDKTGMNYLNFIYDNNGSDTVAGYIDFCLKNGVGISINGVEDNYEWIFTYGELLDFYINSEFYSNKMTEPFTENVIDTFIINKQARIGQPSEKFLPQVAREQIKDFLKTFNLEDINIALVWWLENNRLTLAFDIIPEMFQKSDDETLQSLLHYLGWYLPNQYDKIFIRGNEYFKLL